jgi:aminopeptidase YwaD
MRNSTLGIFIAALLLAGCSSSKKIVKIDTQTTDNLKAHIQYLADDKLEGRRTGTKGEELAAEYITTQFKTIGLLPKGTEYYPQHFIVNDGKKIDETTSFSINGSELTHKDFFPFPYSPDMTLEALPSIAIQEAGMPWFFDLKETLEENKTNPHFDLQDYIRNNSKKANDRGASAVILYNSSSIEDKLAFNTKDRSEKLAIPVIYVSKEVANKYFADKTATLNVKMRIGISEKNRRGTNVLGYIDNGAAKTVILGAHFDHLGYGEDGNSRNTSHEAGIHNGADDNASGTAALIELARKLKMSSATNSNYLFVAFSGEELGLYGSKYFTDHPTIDLKSVNYMINMDMVGRLSDSTKVLTVGGYGTSPSWGTYYLGLALGKKQEIQYRFDSSGTGPSDHTSFYRKDIPVLFYFTGLHTDYHKPSDDADKINYSGAALIVQHIMSVIESLDKQPKLAFTKTREAQTTTTARMNVTMGVMPDYTYSGNGLRADGVSEGKPAHKAGLKAGDIILHVGDYAISSMESYMQMLSKYKKGDKVKVRYKRGNETLETTVEF